MIFTLTLTGVECFFVNFILTHTLLNNGNAHLNVKI